LLLALFLVDAAAGLYLFLPLVGRRNAGVKFYRLILITAGALLFGACVSHALANARELAIADAVVLAVLAVVYLALRYPKRIVFQIPAGAAGVAVLLLAIASWRAATGSSLPWSIAGACASIALLGSVNLAMLLGHWYLVVRGMSIDPLKRLTVATLIAVVLRIIVVCAALMVPGIWHQAALRQGIFFWMRAGWGLIGPLALYPMVWGTVKIRSTMAATGILYVDVVAVVIGEVLGAWLTAIVHVPV
jgi:hypothetical protein